MVHGNSETATIVTLAMLAATAFPAMAQDTKPISVSVQPSGVVQALTEEQCRVFKTAAMKFVQIAGRQNLSKEFVDALTNFAITKKCTGPANIPTDGREIDTFNSISYSVLVATGVNLDKIGVRQIRRVASLESGPK